MGNTHMYNAIIYAYNDRMNDYIVSVRIYVVHLGSLRSLRTS